MQYYLRGHTTVCVRYRTPAGRQLRGKPSLVQSWCSIGLKSKTEGTIASGEHPTSDLQGCPGNMACPLSLPGRLRIHRNIPANPKLTYNVHLWKQLSITHRQTLVFQVSKRGEQSHSRWHSNYSGLNTSYTNTGGALWITHLTAISPVREANLSASLSML